MVGQNEIGSINLVAEGHPSTSDVTRTATSTAAPPLIRRSCSHHPTTTMADQPLPQLPDQEPLANYMRFVATQKNPNGKDKGFWTVFNLPLMYQFASQLKSEHHQDS